MADTAKNTLPTNVGELQRRVSSLEDQDISLRVENLSLRNEIKMLREERRLWFLEKYGPKSEKLSEDQLNLFQGEPSVHQQEIENEAELPEEEKSPKVPTKGKKRPGRTLLPDHLPRVEEIIPCDADQCSCARCGEEKAVIGYDTSEQLDVEPAKYFVKVTKREKRSCSKCPGKGISSAPLPPRILPKGKFSDRVILDIVLGKYRDHLPLHRQQGILLAEAGIEVSRSTLCNQITQVGSLCQSINAAMKKELFSTGYVQADETPVGLQSKETKGRNALGWFWEYSHPKGPVLFEFKKSRGREGPLKYLEGYKGLLQSDGYARKLAPEDPHPREILKIISKLYALEKQWREHGLTSEARQEQRALHSQPIMDELKAKFIATRKRVLPASALGKACDYGMNQWIHVENYVKHGQVEIDNNWCENAIRPIAIGRKNWLHIGSREAGERIAPIISIIETCRRMGINVRNYFADVLPGLGERPQSDLANLTPAA